jgi:hypothetical protein
MNISSLGKINQIKKNFPNPPQFFTISLLLNSIFDSILLASDTKFDSIFLISDIKKKPNAAIKPSA